MPWFAALLQYSAQQLNRDLVDRIRLHTGHLSTCAFLFMRERCKRSRDRRFRDAQSLFRSWSVASGRLLGSSEAIKERRTLVVPMQRDLGYGGVDGANLGGSERCGRESLCLDFDELALDELRLAPKRRFCGLKVDVEGFEGRVLRGARGLLSSQRPKVVVMELSPERSETFEPSSRLQDILEELRLPE